MSESIESVIAMSDLTDTTLFKALDGLRPVHGGDGRYPGVGRWTRHLDPDRLQPCVYGYHLTRGPQVLRWLGSTLYVTEACPDHDMVVAADKVVTCRVRLVRRLDRWDAVTARLFAADCAEAALLGERASGMEPDERSWALVDAARRFARGEIDRGELDAARTAARTAARAAAGAAAWYASDVARDASDVARDAARTAAGAAAWYARTTAWYATSTDAATATWDAWDAAWNTLYRRLCAYLEGSPIPPVEPLYGKETPRRDPRRPE